MAYFDYFPKGRYRFDKVNYKLVSDLFRRIKVKSKILDEASLYSTYSVPNGERPEDTAMKHFGDPELHWVILLTNNITNGYYDWPLDYQAFEEFIYQKYENPDAIHHYEKIQSSGPQTSTDYSHLVECLSTDQGAQAVSNREYEQRLQDQKRDIKLLNPAYLQILQEEFERLMNE